MWALLDKRTWPIVERKQRNNRSAFSLGEELPRDGPPELPLGEQDWVYHRKLQCNICNYEYIKDVKLMNTLKDVCDIIEKKEASMHAMTPKVWMNPELKKCHLCQREYGIFEPLIGGTKKREINWLFLFLTQSLSCCNLGQLKYFFKHNKITIFHSEDKQRIFYATYMALYKQIVPNESVLGLISWSHHLG